MKRLALIGAGGFATELEDIAEQAGWKVTGCYALSAGRFPALHRGYLDELLSEKDHYDGVALGVGAVNRDTLRARAGLIEWLGRNGFSCPPLVAPTAILAKGVTIRDGAAVGPGAIVGLNAVIDSFAVVNCGAIIGHDVAIGPNVTVAPGAFLAGGCGVGEGALIGPLAKVLQNVSIGAGALVGMGATVIRDVPEGLDVWPRPDRALSPS